MTQRTFSFMAAIPHGPADEGAEIDAFLTVGWAGRDTVLTLIKVRPVESFEGYFAKLQQDSLEDWATDWLETEAGMDAVAQAYQANYWTTPRSRT
jgi:hypothetical protein